MRHRPVASPAVFSVHKPRLQRWILHAFLEVTEVETQHNCNRHHRDHDDHGDDSCRVVLRFSRTESIRKQKKGRAVRVVLSFVLGAPRLMMPRLMMLVTVMDVAIV